MSELNGNLGTTERWTSALLGAGFTLAAIAGGGLLRRLAAAAVGASLLTRSATGYCAVKGAMTGDTSLAGGLKEQWNRVKTQTGMTTEGTADIDSLRSLTISELQELRSAEAQLLSLLRALPASFQSSSLDQVLRGYASDLEARIVGLDTMITSMGANPRGHSDRAMRALIAETRRMTKIRPTHVRGSAIVASLQRLVHFKLAGYGTAATYATMLARPDYAERLHGYVEREKEVDDQLTALARAQINPESLGPVQHSRSVPPSVAVTPETGH
jgi:ferritin-like metal-binding protein YciE